MLETSRARRGMVTAPHHLAAQAGLSVLREGGNAIEAMVAAAATIAVVYPHMNGIGGDGFWLIDAPGRTPIAIDACGPAGADVDPALYGDARTLPSRGPLAAITVPGAVAGWGEALAVAGTLAGRLPLTRLVEEAVHHARHGVAVTGTQARNTLTKLDQLLASPGFEETYLVDGQPPSEGAVLGNSRLAETLETIGREGAASFYRGAVAEALAQDLVGAGSPLTAADLAAYRAERVAPLSVDLSVGTAFNHPPPTQGLASLMILALFDRLGVVQADGFAYLHGLVEATKQAFLVRDSVVTDRGRLPVDPATFLTAEDLGSRARGIDPNRALPWPPPSQPGDTVWMGAVDGQGVAVSYIQSLFWEFGSGVVGRRTGVVMQNRGSSFSLDSRTLNRLEPGRKPFHTLNPAIARLRDGRVMTYGTMGGEGQPQTQAALFTRYALFGQPLQQAITAPRWLLGRTWGEPSTTLKLESRFPAALIDQLISAGHEVEVVADFTDQMGHAGAIVRRPDGWLEGAADPRSDGAVAAF